MLFFFDKVAISVLYFALIGLVLLILLLAPKFKPTSPPPQVSVHLENSIRVTEAGTEILPEIPLPAASDDYLEDDSKGINDT